MNSRQRRKMLAEQHNRSRIAHQVEPLFQFIALLCGAPKAVKPTRRQLRGATRLALIGAAVGVGTIGHIDQDQP